MTKTYDRQAALLTHILSAIAGRLSGQEADDVASFIAAGENGLAADTLFCAIADEGIAIDDAVRDELEQVADLYKTFGDLDPDIAAKVLGTKPSPSPPMW